MAPKVALSVTWLLMPSESSVITLPPVAGILGAVERSGGARIKELYAGRSTASLDD